jgi:imidazolonepropionase-like amidohydrolase
MEEIGTKNGRIVLLDSKVFTGSEVWDCGVIVIEAGRIVEARKGQEYESYEGDTVFHLSSHTVLPGFIDCHLHLSLDGGANNIRQAREDNVATATLRALRNAQDTLAAGVTTVRDAGGRREAVFAVRDWIRSGLINGPFILACGSSISMTGGHGWWLPGIEVDGPEEMRHAVRGLVKAGADAIKLMASAGLTDPLSSSHSATTSSTAMAGPQLEEEELKMAVTEAHKFGRKTFAHAHGLEGGKRAAQAEVDSIEHGIFFDEDEEIFALIKERGLWYTPTVAATGPSPLKTVEAGMPEHIIERHRKAYAHHQESFRRALHAGVKLGFGTDSGSSGNPHGRNLRELSCMVDLGLSPLDALKCATSGAASLLGLDSELGTIEPSKLADITIARGDAITNIKSLSDPETIRMVIKEGRVVVAKDNEESLMATI